ncbi:hypothetical protein BDV25DRAFT_130816 [Aspergillus avenaceus]|uniref:HTH APSES-type domain-containing protein n=1 Tax=Aspergillus avenaceus TaxID=36643 RepID=A0A5N6TRW0_ASPAV|nr:hypothetical protein BDV25DRAFT_130816 [Aspergillus avenaceus]
MASIESLLNPLPAVAPPSSIPTSDHVACKSPHLKKQKIAKDAPVFNRGEARGKLRYPPCEERDADLTRLHREFQLHPMGDIAAYPRHIPYNSDKKTFQEKTGRESFELFQYTFKVPGDDKQWTVTWDYNIGLVRTTHLFKCQNFSKTTPAKVLNANPGLRDICHSITGGAIAAQGYWMPYDAAKAVAATFCWRIRYALTPLFGLDFPNLCVPPTDHTRYGRMVIDAAVVRKATEAATFYRVLELNPPELAPLRPSVCHPIVPGEAKKPNTSKHRSQSSQDSSSGYSTPETYCVSPASPIRHIFTPVNTPAAVSRSLPKPHKPSDSDTEGASSDSMDTPTDTDEEYRDSDADKRTRACNMETRSRRKYRSALFAREVKAAHALLSLYAQDAHGEDYIWVEQGKKRRRASN